VFRPAVARQTNCVLPTVVTAWAFAACVKGVPDCAATAREKFGCAGTTAAHPLTVATRLPLALGAANAAIVSVGGLFFGEGLEV
jgi:hypothetical protein